MKKMIISLLATSFALEANELDNLISSSNEILNQVNEAIMMVGGASEYAYQGTALSDGTLASSVHITPEQVSAYNNSLVNMSNYLPFGSVQQKLLDQSDVELDLMEDAIDRFTDTTVQILAVQEVAEMSEQASTPQEENQVKTYVESNIEILTIDETVVEEWNTAATDVEIHANNASAYLAVASNTEAVGFLQQGAENNNTTADMATLSYSANQQWVRMSWAGTSNASAVFLNGQSFGLDLYATQADILSAGSESDFYLTSPTALGYNCFMYGTDCDYESIGN